MQDIKALLAKVWKNEAIDLEPGKHDFDEVLMIHIEGSVTKHADQMVAPTVSIPLILTLALFWEKCGVTRDKALDILREAITEALSSNKSKDEQIEARMNDIETAVEAVRKDLIAKLPKQKRSGRVVTKALAVEVLPVSEEELTTASV